MLTTLSFVFYSLPTNDIGEPELVAKGPYIMKAQFIEPMLCVATSELPSGPQWFYELKLDGYRWPGNQNRRALQAAVAQWQRSE